MKAAFYTYASAFQNIGGGEIQLLKTKEYLEKRGVTIDLFDLWRHHIEDYQILHIFGSVKECLGLVQTAKFRGVKVVVNSGFWSDYSHALYSSGNIRERLTLLIRHTSKIICPIIPSGRRRLFELADLIIPNSEMEKEQIARLFAISRKKVKVAYNAVDLDFERADPGLFREKYGSEPFILSVGRIEPRKNQLNLIRAWKRIKGQRLVLMGSPVAGYETYYNLCQKEAGSAVIFIPTLAHSDSLIKSAYAACSVFVLPGWFETPGLAGLEAALVGARLAVTRGGSTREYYENAVEYFDPSSPVDMAQKIEAALQKPPNKLLKQRILNEFTWDHTAATVERAYKELLTNR